MAHVPYFNFHVIILQVACQFFFFFFTEHTPGLPMLQKENSEKVYLIKGHVAQSNLRVKGHVPLTHLLPSPSLQHTPLLQYLRRRIVSIPTDIHRGTTPQEEVAAQETFFFAVYAENSLFAGWVSCSELLGGDRDTEYTGPVGGRSPLGGFDIIHLRGEDHHVSA